MGPGFQKITYWLLYEGNMAIRAITSSRWKQSTHKTKTRPRIEAVLASRPKWHWPWSTAIICHPTHLVRPTINIPTEKQLKTSPTSHPLSRLTQPCRWRHATCPVATPNYSTGAGGRQCRYCARWLNAHPTPRGLGSMALEGSAHLSAVFRWGSWLEVVHGWRYNGQSHRVGHYVVTWSDASRRVKVLQSLAAALRGARQRHYRCVIWHVDNGSVEPASTAQYTIDVVVDAGVGRSWVAWRLASWWNWYLFCTNCIRGHGRYLLVDWQLGWSWRRKGSKKMILLWFKLWGTVIQAVNYILSVKKAM